MQHCPSPVVFDLTRPRDEPAAVVVGAPLRITWAGALNGDGLDDLLVVVYGACGNWGECMYGAYLNCGEGRFTVAYEPDYAAGLEVGTWGKDGFRQLIRVERWGTSGEPEARWVTLVHTPVGYVAGPPMKTPPAR